MLLQNYLCALNTVSWRFCRDNFCTRVWGASACLLSVLPAFRCFGHGWPRGKICSSILEITQQWVHERKALEHVLWIMRSLRKQYQMKQRTIWINFHTKCFAIFLGKILSGWFLPAWCVWAGAHPRAVLSSAAVNHPRVALKFNYILKIQVLSCTGCVWLVAPV